MKIIINADDFGINTAVNQRIIDLFLRGRITSATIIANAPAAEDAIRISAAASLFSFGVHLNLTEFEPLTPPAEREGLSVCLNDAGHFAGEDRLRSIRFTSKLREAIFHELRLQVEKLHASGINVTHFDSHNHIHTLPALFPVVKRLQKYFEIRKVRGAFNIFASRSEQSLFRKFQKRLWIVALKHYYTTTITGGFTSFSTFYDVVRTRCLKFDSIEVMVHPGHQDFEHETALLYRDWQSDIPFETRLIAYNDF